MRLRKGTVRRILCLKRDISVYILIIIGDTAVFLLKEGADHTLKTGEEILALDLAPDKDVSCSKPTSLTLSHSFMLTIVPI